MGYYNMIFQYNENKFLDKCKKVKVDGEEDLNKITEQVKTKSKKLNGIVDKFDDNIMALGSLMDRKPKTKDKMIPTEGGSIERATVNVNNTNNINTKLKVDQSMITSISNDDSEDTIFITQQSPPYESNLFSIIPLTTPLLTEFILAR